MIMKKLLSTTILLTMFSTSVFAEDMSIEMLNKRDDGAKMVYSKDVARIDVGDTITWLPTSKGHNVESTLFPYTTLFRSTFDVPGVYFYQCTPHKAMGMIAIVVVGDDTSNKDTILKASKAKGKSKKKLIKLLENL